MFIQTLGGIEQAPHLTEHHGAEIRGGREQGDKRLLPREN